MSKPLGAYQLGDVYARNVGVNLRLLRVCIVIFSSILSACIVAFAGPISFVGIAVPHLVKKLLNTTEPNLDDTCLLCWGKCFLLVL